MARLTHNAGRLVSNAALLELTGSDSPRVLAVWTSIIRKEMASRGLVDVCANYRGAWMMNPRTAFLLRDQLARELDHG